LPGDAQFEMQAAPGAWPKNPADAACLFELAV
jgi:hypothetical protein